jgi:UDP-N-acetylmuramyl pentapeptide phosphotransferase/UDP-N-acetylglucosamine-1-phosphate transferase
MSPTIIEFLILVGAATIACGLIAVSQPLLRNYALARPNVRSSHKVPTSQGGGIFVIAATVTVVAVTAYWQPGSFPATILWVLAATIGLAVVGAIDDIRVLEVVPRLLLQTTAVAAVIATFPTEMRVVPELPLSIDRGLLLIGGVWFVNLVNFMDGIDWMTVAEVVPLTAGLAVFGVIDALPREATLVAVALCGAVIGFAPFNRPVARLFLGDVGSLPIGLLLGWLLALLAGRGHLAAALLLPLYYVADATITLLTRLIKGESIMQAHRSHYYQRALDNGFSVYEIVARVFTINIILVALASFTLVTRSSPTHLLTLVAGIGVTGALLWSFTRPHR